LLPNLLPLYRRAARVPTTAAAQPMIQPFIEILGVSVRAYALFVGLGVAFAIGLGWRALARLDTPVWTRGRWLDVCLGAFVLALLLGRAVHVLDAAAYFAAYPEQIALPQAGGLDWRGVLAGGTLGALLVCGLRRLPVGQALYALAWAVPLVALGGWLGCLYAACGVGAEIATLAYTSPLVAAELPDVYGTIAPRYFTQLWGMGLALLLAALVAALGRWRTQADALRFLLAAGVLAAGMLLIGNWQM
jgi:prolipoprotein diacylglyceryltransferase